MNNLKFKISNLKFSRRDGFTIGELIVAMSLFIVIITLAAGAFMQGFQTQREVVSATSSNSNATQALEYIAREIRTGYNFQSTTASTLSFTNGRGESVSYRLTGNSIGRCVNAFSACTYAPITSEKVYITRLGFAAQGTGEPDGLPARITISLGVRGLKNNEVNFQTTVASRIAGE